jgi:hypothetical protein
MVVVMAAASFLACSLRLFQYQDISLKIPSTKPTMAPVIRLLGISIIAVVSVRLGGGYRGLGWHLSCSVGGEAEEDDCQTPTQLHGPHRHDADGGDAVGHDGQAA